MTLCGLSTKGVPICPLGMFYPHAPGRPALRPHCVNIALESDPPAQDSPLVVECDSSDFSDSDSELDIQEEIPKERRHQSKSAAAVTQDSIKTVREHRAKTAVTFHTQGFHKVEESTLPKERTCTPGWGISDRDRMRPTSISMDRSLRRYRWLHSAPHGSTRSRRMIFLTELGELNDEPVTYDYNVFEKTEKKSIPTHLYPRYMHDLTALCQRVWVSRCLSTTEQRFHQHECKQSSEEDASGTRANRRPLSKLLVYDDRPNTTRTASRRRRFYRNISREKSVHETKESEVSVITNITF